jgi:Zn-finger nucleic acid-binding protein
MKCPSCKEVTLSLTERSGIEIDYCPDCRGVWLDRGELDKILAQAKVPSPGDSMESHRPPGPRHTDYDRDYQMRQHSGHYKYKRKKSFLEELFD